MVYFVGYKIFWSINSLEYMKEILFYFIQVIGLWNDDVLYIYYLFIEFFQLLDLKNEVRFFNDRKYV